MPDSLTLTRIHLPRARVFRREIYLVGLALAEGSRDVQFATETLTRIKTGEPWEGRLPILDWIPEGAESVSGILQVWESDSRSRELAPQIEQATKAIDKVASLASVPALGVLGRAAKAVAQLLAVNGDDLYAEFPVGFSREDLEAGAYRFTAPRVEVTFEVG